MESNSKFYVVNAKLNDSQSHIMNEKGLEHQYIRKDFNWILFPVYGKYKVINYMTLFIMNRDKNSSLFVSQKWKGKNKSSADLCLTSFWESTF